MKHFIHAFFFILLLCQGCVNVTYEGQIDIDAPVDVVFSILENYEEYPDFIKDFHSETRIISDVKTGVGVVIDNKYNWKGHSITSQFYVSDYQKNQRITMKNQSQWGYSEMVVEDLGSGKTKYKLKNELRIPKGMQQELFDAFDRELLLVKQECEKCSGTKACYL